MRHRQILIISINIPKPAWKAHYKHGDIDISTFFEDQDEDGYGITANTVEGCEQTSGIASKDGDCDDNNVSVNPGATEIVDNGTDDDCNSDTPDEQQARCPCINEVENALDQLAEDRAPVTSHEVSVDAYFINAGCNPNGEFGFIVVDQEVCELQFPAEEPLRIASSCAADGSVPYGDANYTKFNIALEPGEQETCIQEIEALLAN